MFGLGCVMTGMSPLKRAWATGGLIFAATMLVMIGFFQFFQGLAAIIKGEFFVVSPDYVYKFNVTGWGWIHLILGVILVITGIFLFSRAAWARAVGIAAAVLSAISQFFYMPYYPLWALLIIALNVFVIWALASAPPAEEKA
jgi:hypothetical protein